MSKGENMVERAALAIFEESPASEPTAWEALEPYRRDAFRGYARAVIEALMEPTAPVIVAGGNVILSYRSDGPDDPDAFFVDAFRAALRTILSQPNDDGEGK